MKAFITGGAGFIGSNLAHRLIAEGHDVLVYDNLSRPGADKNVAWLNAEHPGRWTLAQADIRDFDTLRRTLADAAPDVVYHLASQVAVTTSVLDPRHDFEVNALGTFNVLEAVRLSGRQPIVLYASTNKVYGGMEEVAVVETPTGYVYRDFPRGIPETQPLDFHSPYGCSKGTGDQYVRDYARIYGQQTVVFRQSCLAADQPVVTPFGLKSIAHLQPGDIVHSGESWTRVRQVWQTGIKPVRRLTTVNGLQVTLTADHRMIRPHGLYSNRHFAYGDYIAILPESQHMPQWEPVADRVLDPEVYLATVRARSDDPRCTHEAELLAERLLPLQGDRLLAVTEIVGRLFGDGHLGIHHRQSRQTPAYTVQHFGSEAELQAVSQWLSWLGLPTSGISNWRAVSTIPSGHTIEGRSRRIQQQSIPVFTLFELLGVPVGDKVRVSYGLPAWVSGGSRLVKRAFLRGFFGAELCQVYPNSQISPSFAQTKDVNYLDNGRQWVQQLRDLLAEFGIETSCFEGQPVEYKRGTTVQITVRLLGGSGLYPKLAAIGYAFSDERTRRLNALLRWRWTHTSPEWFEPMHRLHAADGSLFWDSLGTIEELCEQPVYDLEVEADSHLFLAGGVQVSNCIYGTRQFGVEDQGWVAWFLIAAVTGRPITIYGNGKQVRDVLWVDDLLDLYQAAIDRIGVAAGQVYNVGGGPDNVLAVWSELGPMLTSLLGRPVEVGWADWRPGDQRIFVADVARAERELGWRPKVSKAEGVRRLYEWVVANKHLF